MTSEPPQHDATPPPPSAMPPVSSENAEGVSCSKPWRLFRHFTGKKLSRRTRWILRGLVATPLLLVSAGLILTRSPVVGYVVAGLVKENLGSEFHASRAVLTLDGNLVVEGMSLRVPGLDGSAGEFVTASKAEVELDWSKIRSGVVSPKTVKLERPVFRVSNSKDDGTLNLQGLHPTVTAAKPNTPPLKIEVADGTLELSEHGRDGYDVLKTINVSGALTPSEAEPWVYLVRFDERVEAPAPGASGPTALARLGMVLDGKVDLRSSVATMRLVNVDLASWPATTVPRSMRDVWGQLNIKGRIASTSLEYYPATGVASVVKLDDVSMDAIVPANFPTGEASQDTLSLRRVNGTLKISSAGLDADVAGLVESQTFPSRVVLKTKGVSTDSALECTIISRQFKLEKDPSLLPFAPPIVRERLGNFCGPTAVVDADVTIRRGVPTKDGPAPFKVDGWLTFAHGSAAFDRVPYPFKEMEGRVVFDDEKIEIQRIKGIGPNGAMLTAKARIAPPDESAAVDVDVVVKNVPLDKTFLDSLPPSRAEAVEFIFNRDRYRELLDGRLVVPTKDKENLQRTLADATSRLEALKADPQATQEQIALATVDVEQKSWFLTTPEFDLGGKVDLGISVHSPAGKDAPWHYTVDVWMPRVGVLAKAFPLPILADNLRLSVSESEAKVVSGTFRGVTGGTATVAANVQLETDGKPDLKPNVTIEGKGIPVDRLLANAAPKRDQASRERGASAADVLRDFGVRGAIDCLATITPTTDSGVALDAKIDLRDVEATAPAHEDHSVVSIRDISGSVHVTSTALEVNDVGGTVYTKAPSAVNAVEAGTARASARMPLNLGASLLPGGEPGAEKAPATPRSGVTGAVQFSNFELSTRLEDAIGYFSPEVAEAVRSVRDDHRPEGRVGGSLRFKQSAGGETEMSARVEHVDSVSLNALSDRLTAWLASGWIRIDRGAETTVTFENAQLDVVSKQESPVRLRVDGSVPFGTSTRDDRREQAVLNVLTDDAKVESSLVKHVLAAAIGDEGMEEVNALGLTGVFDADVQVVSSHAGGSEGPSRNVIAAISPKRLGFDLEGNRVELTDMSGKVVSEGKRVRIDRMGARTPTWSTMVDGTWDTRATGGVFDGRFTVKADALTPEIRSLLPKGLASALDRVDLKVAGPFWCTDGRIRYSTEREQTSDGDGAGAALLSGVFVFNDASMDIGAPLTHADGELSLSASREPGPSPWGFDLGLRADQLLAGGIAMTNLRARVSSGANPGEVLIPSLSADCYAGRVWASARVADSSEDLPSPVDPALAGGIEYDANITMSGVCFAPVLAALDTAKDAGETPTTVPSALVLENDPSRGRMDGTLAIHGVTGEHPSRSGTGAMRIAGGDIVAMPLVVAMVQLSNLQIPLGDKLDFLQVLYRIDQERVVFDDVSLLSSGLSINGWGTMSWPDLELDLRFNSKSTTRVPVLSDVMEALRDEIATTRIRGTISNPKVAPEPLTGTRDLIGTIVGEGPNGKPTDEKMSTRARLERARMIGLPIYRSTDVAESPR